MKKILLIEDESALQKALGDTLKINGYEMLSALNGQIGLDLAEAKKPDLILLDLILPKIDGFEVLKHLKENPETKDIPVIVLTNLEGIKDVSRVVEMGATTYLVKSDYSLKEIVSKIKEILSV
ncbi:response regulator [Patescibacteria group bacterium]|nr:response regulator [Patescibacteria group bacterium]